MRLEGRVLTLLAAMLFTMPHLPLHADPLDLKSSTQVLWGDDLLGQKEPIVANYLRFDYERGADTLSVAGYGRVSKDFGDGVIRENRDALGRLYYLYADYRPFEETKIRFGRQYVNFTADSSILDGAAVDLENISEKFGITAAAGSDVRFGLDHDESSSRYMFAGMDVHLKNYGPHQLGVSYVRKYDSREIASENFGVNARTMKGRFSPYAEAVYSYYTESFEEAVLGLDFFYSSSLTMRGEFYHSYPSFDSTSIYSVFAVDRYSEYLFQAEYYFSSPATLTATYKRQRYGEGENADVYALGVRTSQVRDLVLNLAMDYRNGFGGKVWGTEIYGDYTLRKGLLLSAGAQNDSYDRRKEDYVEYSAQRFWVGCNLLLKKNLSLIARIENNVNRHFDQRYLGRVTLDYTM